MKRGFLHKSVWVDILFLIVLVFLAHGMTIGNGLMIDDFGFLSTQGFGAQETQIKDFFTRSFDRHYYPFHALLTTELFHLSGNSPALLHVVNVSSFALMVCLIYVLASFLGLNIQIAFFSSVLFALHPVNATVVNFIACNHVLVSSCFLLLSLICFIKATDREGNKQFFILSLILYFLGTFWHETTIFFPLMIFFFAFFVRRKSFFNSLKLSLLYGLIAAVYLALWIRLAVRFTQMTESITFFMLNIVDFLATIAKLVFWYLVNMVLPTSAVLIKHYPIVDSMAIPLVFAVGLLALLALGLVWFWGRTVRSFLLLCFLMSFLVLIPASLGHPYMGLVLEPHWFLLFSVGFIILLVKGIDGLRLSDSGKKIFFVLLTLSFGALTIKYHNETSTEKEYCWHWLRHDSSNPIALINLAKIVSEEGDHKQALAYSEQLLKMYPYYKPETVCNNLAQSLLALGRQQEAVQYLEYSLSLDPNYYPAFNTLGTIFAANKQHDTAKKYFQAAIELDKGYVVSLLNLADLHLLDREFKEAEVYYWRVLSADVLNKKSKEVVAKLSRIYARTAPKKLIDLMEWILKKDKQGDLFLSFCLSLEQADRGDMSFSYLKRFISSYPRNKELILLLGINYANRKQFDEAIAWWQKGRRIKPKDLRFEKNIREAQTLMQAQ